MADFTARYTAGATVVTWDDPASGGTPKRTRPDPEHLHKRHQGEVGTEVEVTATVAGVEGELDVNLSGLLFAFHFAELPGISPPAVTSPAGQSSVQAFTPPAAGHYTFKLKREEHGEIYFHLDAVDP